MPTGYTPTFEIYKGGENVTANFLNRATNIEVSLSSGNGMQNSCSITVDDRDWLVSSPHVGDGIEVYLGYKEIGTAYMGVFMIDRVRFDFPPKTISIHGTAVDFKGSIKSSITQSFENKTVGEVISGVLEKTGLSLKIDPSIGAQKLPYFNATTSPLAVLDQLARQFGGVVSINGSDVSIAKRDAGTSASGVTLQTLVYGPESFASVSVEHLNRGQYDKVVAAYRDKDKNEDVEVTAGTQSSGFLNESGQASGTGDRAYRIKGSYLTKELAQAAAKSAMQGLDDSLGQGQFQMAVGDPWIRDSQRLIIRGTRDGIDAQYQTDLVRHVYTKDGALQTFITTKPPNTGDSSGAYNIASEGTIIVGAGQVAGQFMPLTGPQRNFATVTPALN